MVSHRHPRYFFNYMQFVKEYPELFNATLSFDGQVAYPSPIQRINKGSSGVRSNADGKIPVTLPVSLSLVIVALLQILCTEKFGEVRILVEASKGKRSIIQVVAGQSYRVDCTPEEVEASKRWLVQVLHHLKQNCSWFERNS